MACALTHTQIWAAANCRLLQMFCNPGLQFRTTSSMCMVQELELKTGPLAALLRPPKRLAEEPNINALWARLLIDELCRQGVSTFCIAPGERALPYVWHNCTSTCCNRDVPAEGQHPLQCPT